MPNQTITKTMTAPSTTAVGSISSAAVPVVVLNTSNFATQRRLTLWSCSVALSSTFQLGIYGTREGGQRISETIVPSTIANTPNVTVQDFLSVSSFSYSTSPTQILHIGLSSIGSTPWYVTNTLASPFNLGLGLVYSASNATTTASVDYTTQDISPIFTSTGVFTPTVFGVSTAVSTTGVTAAGAITFPVTAFRLTVNTTNAANTGVTLYTVPGGLGS